MRITFVITGLNIGGAEIQVCNLADELSDAGNNVQLISISGNSQRRPKNSAIHLVELLMLKNSLSFLKAYFQARKTIREFQPDIVHSHMVHANIFSRLLRITTPIPKLISTSHNSYEGGSLRAFICRITDPLSTLSTNVSLAATKSIINRGSVNKNKVATIHNGIKIENFCFNEVNREKLRREIGVDPQTPLLLSVGRLAPAKDYPNLLRAFAAIKNSTPVEPQLAIIGSGALETELKTLAIELGVADRVHWLGMKTNVHEWLSAGDIFVMSSAWEGFPLVIIEAMAAERVVVATDCGGIREALSGNGFLVPPHSSAALAEAIIKALNLSPEEARQMGAASRCHIEQHFSMSAIAQKWIALYRSL
ncbi:glycosyltransferase [Enterobacter sp. 170198]|uniref:Glycosyltransferase n=1 Tax=Enterobacter chinensis TaxID=3030997 RepID=A0ABU5CZK5_9ENTR|nr:glycosyltransferase [Enterobacter sp. 170198]MDY0417098.1 glycosyltransferase [Enterobacter sp. 170198]